MSPGNVAVLVVEDDELTRHVLVRSLGKEGYQVTPVGGGQDALDLVQRQPFDLVLLDLEMPAVNGLEVLLGLRQAWSITQLPIIIVSGRDQTGDMIGALRLGANDFVSKPVHVPLLLTRIETQLALKQLTPPPVAAFGGRTEAVGPRPSIPSLEETRATLFRSADETPGPGRDDPSPLVAEPGSTRVTNPRPVLLAEYEIRRELGRGGMGIVYEARDRRMNRIVALKVISPDYLSHPESLRRFSQEVQAVAQLNHPNIVFAHDAGESDKVHYLVMEYVAGTDLAKWVRANGPLRIDQACECIRQTALGLQHAHERGLVHRDIKPNNLLVACGPPEEEGNASLKTDLPAGFVVKILDMGLVLPLRPAVFPSGGGVTGDGTWLGTADYVAPEQTTNPHMVDGRADLYSLGCTFYELLTGRVPFPNGTPVEKAIKHMFEEPFPVQELRPDLTDDVVAIVRRLMAKNPEDRFHSAKEVSEALRCLTPEPPEAPLR